MGWRFVIPRRQLLALPASIRLLLTVPLRVTSDNSRVVARIKGLGFFRLIASQDHHREHHLMMALSEDAHGH
jgi:hypothetical protein